MAMRNLIFLAVLLGGCAVAPTQQALQITQTRDLVAVRGCTYLMPIATADIRGGQTGMTNAMNFVLNEAAKLKATHVLWTDMNPAIGRAAGDAYACPSNQREQQAGAGADTRSGSSGSAAGREPEGRNSSSS